jgi:hypothetical protein
VGIRTIGHWKEMEERLITPDPALLEAMWRRKIRPWQSRIGAW